MKYIFKLARVQVIVLGLFVLMKVTRPSILNHDTPEFLRVFWLSFPNFCEAIVGTLTLTMLGLLLNMRVLSTTQKIKVDIIYLLATFLAGVYVISQEFKIHNLGGNNVFDPYDVLFSIIGLLVAYGIVKAIHHQNIYET
ncbi:MAG TPA: hypothetical protein DCS93_04980 [Microscillaceae bacterium]|nr:hypothetical protein [Microscillaceae bacterium]